MRPSKTKAVICDYFERREGTRFCSLSETTSLLRYGIRLVKIKAPVASKAKVRQSSAPDSGSLSQIKLGIKESGVSNKPSTYRCLRRTSTRRSNVHSKLKLVWTTLLIVSTFSLSWGLCVLYFVLVCVDGCPFTYNVSLNFYLGLFLNSSVNCLVMLKLASNPFIYTLRIRAIKASVDTFLAALFHRKTYPTKNNKTSVALLSTSSGAPQSL
ncbi:hypothetical protein NECAME_16380 [Necator americanus]|uniref:G-protein coupled receptors family 1 profile domain-containing protein n=1 Tax=Necator americanus TaxID=51031 RepID=W2TZA7_NECAM|nr:hypothetical protein NECAME_16380 [Necator americanus]ETN86357.1 hypothetical protein NECAME_16380 [Necator americanus]